VIARLWEIQIGRVPLFLLDTDVDGNTISDRELTARLYSSDLDLRISQEILLGMGGVRALRVLGYNPSVWHLNEGHSAFLNLERAREMVESGYTFEEAQKKICNTSIFTTHTPVPAGNDEFPLWLMDVFLQLWPELGLDRDRFINLALNLTRGEYVSMPVLALGMSEHRNGVSELHGKSLGRCGITSGQNYLRMRFYHAYHQWCHTGSWLARRLRHLYDLLRPGLDIPVDDQTWERSIIQMSNSGLYADI
jgi:starch phosphorylase